jgi:hypothetical protein
VSHSIQTSFGFIGPSQLHILKHRLQATLHVTILNRWKSYFSQLLNFHDISDVRQTEIHTAEPLVPGPSHFEVEISIAKLKEYKTRGSDQIPAEMYQAGGETLVCGPQTCNFNLE